MRRSILLFGVFVFVSLKILAIEGAPHRPWSQPKPNSGGRKNYNTNNWQAWTQGVEDLSPAFLANGGATTNQRLVQSMVRSSPREQYALSEYFRRKNAGVQKVRRRNQFLRQQERDESLHKLTGDGDNPLDSTIATDNNLRRRTGLKLSTDGSELQRPPFPAAGPGGGLPRRPTWYHNKHVSAALNGAFRSIPGAAVKGAIQGLASAGTAGIIPGALQGAGFGAVLGSVLGAANPALKIPQNLVGGAINGALAKAYIGTYLKGPSGIPMGLYQRALGGVGGKWMRRKAEKVFGNRLKPVHAAIINGATTGLVRGLAVGKLNLVGVVSSAASSGTSALMPKLIQAPKKNEFAMDNVVIRTEQKKRHSENKKRRSRRA